MLAPLVAVLLAAHPPVPSHPTPPSRWPEATTDEADEDEAPHHSRLRALRFGAGAATISTVSGVAPSFDVGAELALAGERLALRLELEGALQFRWGVVGATPSLVLYAIPGARVSPYLAGGIQLGVANITEEALGRTSTGSALGVLRGAAAAGPPDTPMGEGIGGGAGGPTPLRFTWGPQATAGVVLRVAGNVGLDVGLRYTSVRWQRDRLSGFGAALAVVAPL